MNAAALIRRAALVGSILVLAGCATRQPPLYMWESFPEMQYETLLGHGDSPSEQIGLMEAVRFTLQRWFGLAVFVVAHT